jgi:hypothetical protein
MNEGALLIGKLDVIVRGRANPNGLPAELPRPAPDAQVMSRREGVVGLFKHQIPAAGRPTGARTQALPDNRDSRPWRGMFPASTLHSASPLHRPTGLLKRLREFLLASEEHQIRHVGRFHALLRLCPERFPIHQLK